MMIVVAIKALAGALMSNLQRALILAAVLLGTNAITGLFSYVKGHNAAAAKCQINSIIRQRDDFKRDRDNAIATSAMLDKALRELTDKQSAREKKDNDDATALSPVPDCVVPAVRKRLRVPRAK